MVWEARGYGAGDGGGRGATPPNISIYIHPSKFSPKIETYTPLDFALFPPYVHP